MNTIFLQQEGGSNMIFMMIAIFAVMYLFMILPQKRKQKKETQFIETLRKGQNIVTTSGIHGKIMDLGETSVGIETGAGKIKFEKIAISVDLTKKIYPTEEIKKA